MRKALILLAVLLSAFAVSAQRGNEESTPAPDMRYAPAPRIEAHLMSPRVVPSRQESNDRRIPKPMAQPVVDFPEEEDRWKLKLGGRYTIRDIIAITPSSFEISKKLGCYGQGAKTLEGAQYFAAGKGKVLLVLRMDIQNLSPEPIDFAKLLTAKAVCGEESTIAYVYQADHSNGTDDNAKLYEPNDIGRQNERFAIDKADNFPIKPQETGHFIICVPVPDMGADGGGSYDLVIAGMGCEAVFDASSQAPSPAGTEARGEGPFQDDVDDIPRILSQIRYLRETGQTLDTKWKGLDSIQYARNTYLQFQIAQRLAEQTATLEKKKTRLTTNGARLKMSFNRLDRTAKMFRFDAFIDLGAAKTIVFDIGVPFSYLIHLTPESPGWNRTLNELPKKFAAGWTPFVLGVVCVLASNDDGGCSPLAEEIILWDSHSGAQLGRVEDLKLPDFDVSRYNPDDIERFLWSPDYAGSPDRKYRKINPFGLTRSLRELSEEAARRNEQKYVLEFDRLEKEARAKAEEMARKPLDHEKLKPPVEAAKPNVPPIPGPVVVVKEEEKVRRRAFDTFWSVDAGFLPFAFDLETLRRSYLREGLPMRFVARTPSWLMLAPMASVGLGEPANGVYIGWETCSSAKLFSVFSLYLNLSGGLEIGNVVCKKNGDGETARPRPTLMTKTRCECGLVVALPYELGDGLGVGASLIVDLTASEVRVGFGLTVLEMEMQGDWQ